MNKPRVCPKCSKAKLKLKEEILLELMSTMPASIYYCPKCGLEIIDPR